MPHIMWFDQIGPEDMPEVGGKSASLGGLTCAGLPVPPGFAVTADAYRKALADSGISDRVEEAAAAADPDRPATVSAAGRQARAMIAGLELPAGLTTAIAAAYAQLSARCAVADVPVAVRSSATCEDQPDASFAGEHDTFLWVRGADAVIGQVRRCWASLYTDRAISYRLRMGYRHTTAAMCVAVQKMVLPSAAGVAFTLNPLDGDRSQIAIDASFGFGEAVVSGEVTPDNFLVDKVLGEITRRTISAKQTEYRLTGHDSVEPVPVGADRQQVPSLTDDQVRAVARLARAAERHYGRPQDVEWAVDSQLPDGENVLLLQSRPETVWSNRPRAATCTADPFQSIVSTLLRPAAGNAAGSGHGHG